MQEAFGWSQTTKGLVLSSFFVGYMLFMFASGWLATRYGGKRVLGIAVLLWSVFTLLTPPAAAISMAWMRSSWSVSFQYGSLLETAPSPPDIAVMKSDAMLRASWFPFPERVYS